jgi:hypothetical protein
LIDNKSLSDTKNVTFNTVSTDSALDGAFETQLALMAIVVSSVCLFDIAKPNLRLPISPAGSIIGWRR